MSENSFGARDTLEVGGREYEIFRLDALQQRFDVARLPFSLKVLLENLLRTEGNGSVTAADIEALASWDAKAEPSKEIAFTPGAGADAGLHRRARRRRSGGDARRDGRDGRRSRADQPARPGRAGDRPLRAGRRVRHARRLPRQRRAGVRAKPASATPSCAGARAPSSTSRSCPPDTGIVHQVNLEYLAAGGLPAERHGRDPGLPRHAGRHRLAHDDDQRPGRARLGRRRDRGRGGDARPADVDADPAGARRSGCTASCPRARPRPTSC